MSRASAVTRRLYSHAPCGRLHCAASSGGSTGLLMAFFWSPCAVCSQLSCLLGALPDRWRLLEVAAGCWRSLPHGTQIGLGFGLGVTVAPALVPQLLCPQDEPNGPLHNALQHLLAEQAECAERGVGELERAVEGSMWVVEH